MVFEPLVFERDNRPAQVRRDARQRHFDAIFLENRENRPVMDVVQRRRLRHFPKVAKLFAVGKAGEERPEQHNEQQADDPASNAAIWPPVHKNPPFKFLKCLVEPTVFGPCAVR